MAVVLIIDDSPTELHLFQSMLEKAGFDTLVADSGEEGLKKIGTDGFDLVLTDIKMPGMDGLEMAQRIKEMNPWMPIVVVTGYGSEANEAKAEEVGVTEFLRKPLTPETIEQVTAKTLRTKEADKAVTTETAVHAVFGGQQPREDRGVTR